MKKLSALTRRNTLLFFKDKGMFFTSLITPAILLVLYATFLSNVYRSSFTSEMPGMIPISEKLIDAFVGGQLISSILAVSCVTVAFCSNMLMVQDKAVGTVKDLRMTPVMSSTLALSYYFATLLTTLIVCFAAMALCMGYMAVIGWCLTVADVLRLLLDVLLMTMFGTALSSVIGFFLSTQGQISAVGTIISAGYGFICGAYMPISQYGDAFSGEAAPSFSALLDSFYEKREQLERVRQKGQDLQRTAAGARDRMVRKLAVQEKEYAKTLDRDKLRIYGELITANLYQMEKGQSSLSAQNYYDPDCATVEIPLDPLLTPQQNAARYFKLYNKAKTAEKHLAEQMEIARRERDWLESVLDELSRAEAEQDFNEIRRELREAGYLKQQSGGKKEPKRPQSKPRQFRSSAGLRILVGRSNTQNDQLVREAFKSDYWFHTQRIHGSHVILRTEGQEPDPESMTEAAILAAWFSQGRESGQVAVDYTQIRNVKKPNGARPGMVVYDPYQTAYVTPSEEIVKRLSV